MTTNQCKVFYFPLGNFDDEALENLNDLIDFIDLETVLDDIIEEYGKLKKYTIESIMDSFRSAVKERLEELYESEISEFIDIKLWLDGVDYAYIDDKGYCDFGDKNLDPILKKHYTMAIKKSNPESRDVNFVMVNISVVQEGNPISVLLPGDLDE